MNQALNDEVFSVIVTILFLPDAVI